MLLMRVKRVPCRGGPLVWLVPLMVLVLVSGCKHRRSALRPVILGPEPALVVPADPCPPGEPCPSVPSGVISPGFDDPGILSPSYEDPGFPAISPPPSAAPRAPEPPRTRPGEEPGIETIPPGILEDDYGPELLPPAAQRAAGGTRTAAGTPRRAELRVRVEPFVNDPGDLFFPPKADRPWKYIVLHHSANPSGSYDQLDRDHRRTLGWDGCGYHFVIGNGTESPDGQIEVAQRWSDQKHGVHSRDSTHPDINEYGIGICLIGDFDSEAPTPRQVAAARALVAYLSDRYEVPASRVGTHAQFAHGPTACPGTHFPTAAILGPRNVARR